MWSVTVFPQENPLPGAEQQSARPDRHTQSCLRQCTAGVRRHVIRAFTGMDVVGIAVRRQTRKRRFQIALYIRVRVFGNQQRCTGVLNENRTESDLHATVRYNPGNFTGDIERAASSRVERQKGLMQQTYPTNKNANSAQSPHSNQVGEWSGDEPGSTAAAHISAIRSM